MIAIFYQIAKKISSIYPIEEKAFLTGVYFKSKRIVFYRMNRKYFFLGTVLLIILFAGSAYPEISQYFYQEGNLSLSRRKKGTELIFKVRRYSIPEGIELKKDIRYEFYPVFGRTFSEIVRSAEENGPFDKKENRRYLSKFDWGIGWSYQYSYTYIIDNENNTVHVSVEIFDMKIEYDITITLPTLIDDTALNPVEKNLWKSYFLKLMEYEHDHAKIVKDDDLKNTVINNITDISYLIFDYKSNTDIEQKVVSFIKKETSEIGYEWLKQIKSRKDEYDSMTEQGKKPEMREAFFKQK